MKVQLLTATAGLILFLSGCDSEASRAASEVSAGPWDLLPVPVFEGRVKERIASLEEVVRSEGEQRPQAGRDPGNGELDALIDMFLNAKGRMRDVPGEEVRGIGLPALEPLVTLARDEEQDAGRRNAALHLIAAIEDPAAGKALVAILGDSREPWQRRTVAWLLGQRAEDHVLLPMTLALRYEKDSETVVWLAEALAHHKNFAGLDGLERVAGEDTSAGALAREKQASLVAQEGLESFDKLRELWGSAQAHEAWPEEPSAALQLDAWRELGELSSERFQLRGVDDARFMLCRTGPWGARLVAEALVDEDAYIRVHALQVLERMGARAQPVGDAMAALLRDPHSAHAAAEALGALNDEAHLPLLVDALRPGRPHELRVGAAHGLGKLGRPAAAPALQEELEREECSTDLKLALAVALLHCGKPEPALPVLIAGMEDLYDDPQGCEVALATWLEELGDGDEDCQALWEAWQALEGPPPLLRSRGDTEARLLARAKLLRDRLASSVE